AFVCHRSLGGLPPGAESNLAPFRGWCRTLWRTAGLACGFIAAASILGSELLAVLGRRDDYDACGNDFRQNRVSFKRLLCRTANRRLVCSLLTGHPRNLAPPLSHAAPRGRSG